MQNRKPTFFLALLLTAACASAAHAQTTMRYKFASGEKLAYVIEQKTKTTMNFMGQDIKMDSGATINLTWEVVKLDDDGNAHLKIKVTHSKMSLDSLLGMVTVDSKDKALPDDPAGKILGQMNNAFAAMEITGVMLPTGELKDVKVSEATVKAMKAIPGAEKLGDLAHPDNFKDMLGSLVFPTSGVTKGKSWTHKTESQTPDGKVNTEHVFTLEETIDKGGVKLDKISLKPEIKVENAPKAMMKVKSVKASGHALFDNKSGRFVESTIVQTKEGKVSVMGLGLDSTSEQTTTIRLKVQTAEEKTALAKAIKSIKINEDEYVEKKIATEELETVAGVARSFTLERTYETSISMTGSAKAPDDLKAMVESALSVSLGKKTTVKETFTLDGKDVTRINVVWVERYRQGTATLQDGSTMSYLVKVGGRFKLEKAK